MKDTRYTLVIGNKNYSSWSLRPWLFMRVAGIPFQEVRIALFQPGFAEKIRQWSPAGRVPVLVAGSLTVWDSLAIIEFLAEHHPQAGAWPAHEVARARARSVCAEMHAGFPDLRAELPMNCRAVRTGLAFSDAARAQIARVLSIWRECRTAHGAGGPYLFGQFCAADAFYAPVASRFLTYQVGLDDVAREYVDAVRALPAFHEWNEAARAEPEIIDEDERGDPA